MKNISYYDELSVGDNFRYCDDLSNTIFYVESISPRFLYVRPLDDKIKIQRAYSIARHTKVKFSIQILSEEEIFSIRLQS